MGETGYISSTKDLLQWFDLRIFTGPEVARGQNIFFVIVS